MYRWLIVVLTVLPLTVLAATPKNVTLDVQNMTCELCPLTIKKSLEPVTGVRSATVDLDKKTATVSFDPDKVQPQALTQATTNAGYPSTIRH
ncbi:MAG: heavy-metal-associated domain-containing protein [Sulfuricaulis sp.]